MPVLQLPLPSTIETPQWPCFAAAGLCGEELERRAAYFHLIAWSLPLVLTITIMALAEVEADSLAGICFLSSAIHIRIGFLLLPVILIVIIGGFFLGRGKDVKISFRGGRVREIWLGFVMNDKWRSRLFSVIHLLRTATPQAYLSQPAAKREWFLNLHCGKLVVGIWRAQFYT